MHVYPQFSRWISIALAKICFSRIATEFALKEWDQKCHPKQLNETHGRQLATNDKWKTKSLVFQLNYDSLPSYSNCHMNAYGCQ